MNRILFVDDEVKVLKGLQRMLRPQHHDWEMAFAPGGEAALSMLDESPFDVIVSDMRMPGIDGAALLEIVRQKYPTCCGSCRRQNGGIPAVLRRILRTVRAGCAVFN